MMASLASALVGVLLLELLHEFGGAGEGDLVDVLVDLLLAHADAGIADGQRLGLAVEDDVHLGAVGIAFDFANPDQGLALLSGVDGVGDELPQENLVVAVKELLDDRKDVFRLYVDLALLHVESMVTTPLQEVCRRHLAQKKPPTCQQAGGSNVRMSGITVG